MKRFKSAGQAQRFLSAHDPISNLFHLRQAARAQALATWADITGATAAAYSGCPDL